MIKEKYEKYKQTYNNYLLLIKSGNFYVCLNEDAIVMHVILNYKIKENSNYIRVGFPINSKDKVLNFLMGNKINYLVVDNDIIDKYKDKTNRYNIILNGHTNYNFILNRINNINKILKNNLSNKNINNIINDIEGILCKINY